MVVCGRDLKALKDLQRQQSLCPPELWAWEMRRRKRREGEQGGQAQLAGACLGLQELFPADGIVLR